MSAAAPPSRVSFLSLPYKVRKRIYCFADLVRECPATIIPTHSRGVIPPGPRSSWVAGRKITCVFIANKDGGILRDGDPECVCPDFPKQLLFICKLLHKEVQVILYSQNTFIVRAHREAEDLKVLQSLSINAISSLSRLVVRLNSWPCIRGHRSAYLNEEYECGDCSTLVSSSDPKLIAGNAHSDQIIEEWKGICQRLKAINPGQLRLEFIADVENLVTAKRLLEPMASLPQLKECAIRLGREQDYKLRSLAYSTATRLTNKYPAKETPLPPQLSLSSLPQEIRLHILWYTNLGPGGSDSDTIFIAGGNFDHPNSESVHLRLEFAIRRCCLKCSFTGLHCSCTLDFPSYNARCQCRVLPLELFLVSRQMHQDATEILYSTNTFLFSGDFSDTENMLRGLSPQALKHMKRIKFSIDGEQTTEWSEHESKWLSLLSFINKNGKPLLITIETPDDYGDLMDGNVNDEEMMRDSRDFYDAYISIARGIKTKLTGIRDIHLFLGVFFALEPVLERYVMGPEYDSKHGNRYSKAAHSFELYPNAHDDLLGLPPWHKDL